MPGVAEWFPKVHPLILVCDVPVLAGDPEARALLLVYIVPVVEGDPEARALSEALRSDFTVETHDLDVGGTIEWRRMVYQEDSEVKGRHVPSQRIACHALAGLSYKRSVFCDSCLFQKKVLARVRNVW